MNNGMLMMIVGLSLLWMISRRPGAGRWIGGSQAAQETAAYEIGF